MNILKIYFVVMCDTKLLLKSMKIALVVGTILNIVNQGDYIFKMEYEYINYLKLIFTYCVPFIVSTYTAISLKMTFLIGEPVAMDTTLKCKGCNKKIHLLKNEVIPICDTCLEKTKWRMG